MTIVHCWFDVCNLSLLAMH